MSTRTPIRPSTLGDLTDLADRRPLTLAAIAFGTGVAALVVSVPPITVAATQPTYVDPAGATAVDVAAVP